MFSRLIGHLRGNAIAYVALFVALGGTSYAATSLPRNSVGTPQLRTGAVTPSKLSSGVGGRVWAVTTLSFNGTVVASSPRAKTKDWRVSDSGLAGVVVYARRFPHGCVPLATALNPNDGNAPGPPIVSAALSGLSEVSVQANSESGISLAVVCSNGK